MEVAMPEHAVVIAGGGPTGLMLAGELALAGVDVAIVERRTSQELEGMRAGGLHARTIELLDQRGIAERFLSQGRTAQIGSFGPGVPLDVSDLPTRHNYGLVLTQSRVEEILAGRVDELGVPIHRGRAVTGFAQDDEGVDVETGDGTPLRARYLVGCDGGRSVVRKAAGIGFPGWDPSVSYIIAEAETAQEPEVGLRHDAKGVHAIGPLGDGTRMRMVIREEEIGNAGEPTLRDLSDALVAVRGTDYGVHDVTWISRFTDMSRQAAAYRDRRVLLAGDAAHIHSPVGGQGLNTGVQDAVNLGWKLAQVVAGMSPEALLDTYHAERHPVGARVLRATMAMTALQRADDRLDALAGILSDVLLLDEPRRRLAAMISGLDVRYDLGDGHPLLGRRMPDLDLETADGPVRAFALLHAGRSVLLNLGAPGAVDADPWGGRVRGVDARRRGPWERPAVGPVAAPAAVLIRPDGHVAWVGEGTDAGLADALAAWVGRPAVAAAPAL
jgi:2-polyprenyl-6-methoxyphenol hydroxylase-like FAD-dependent oxidoreductase